MFCLVVCLLFGFAYYNNVSIMYRLAIRVLVAVGFIWEDDSSSSFSAPSYGDWREERKFVVAVVLEDVSLFAVFVLLLFLILHIIKC